VDRQGVCFVPIANVIAKLTDILLESGRVYLYEGRIVLDSRSGIGKLEALSGDGTNIKVAASRLANIVICQRTNENTNKNTEFSVPVDILQVVICNDAAQEALPQITLYSRRPVFDADFLLRQSGWHKDVGYLIHGGRIDAEVPCQVTRSGPLIDRLPPILRELLRDFCFRTEGDLANAVGALLTGLLASRFITTGKPLFVLDGNQPSVGKTLFARLVGVLLDGTEPKVIRYRSDEAELEKSLCSTLRKTWASIVVFDNARDPGGEICNTTIEAHCTAVVVNIRVLQTSTTYERPNDLVWFLTMNNTRLNGDMMSRSCPIRFYHEGDPKSRSTTHDDLVKFATDNRNELLAALFGMIAHWRSEGEQRSQHNHRLREWARTIGGILQANGLDVFLSNLDEATAEFNTDAEDFDSLAQQAVLRRVQGNHALVVMSSAGVLENTTLELGVTASGMYELFLAAGIMKAKLLAAKPGSISNIIGGYLSKFKETRSLVMIRSATGLGQSTPGTTIFRKRECRGNKKYYYFELIPDADGETSTAGPSLSPPSLSPDLSPRCVVPVINLSETNGPAARPA